MKAAVIATAALCIAAAPAGTEAMETPFEPAPYVTLQHPEWSRDAAIYQVNTRQFTPEGTLAAARAQLPRLAALGVRIVWLMPVQPIGEKNRKGTLGSPYSVRDYTAVNPEFGDLDDFKAFVAAAHELGLYVILDWVANHTAWDNPLVERHPEWFSRDHAGRLHPPVWTDWSDVVQLDYRQPGLWRHMADAMRWWVAETGIDGFRCDVAGFVPVGFWNGVRAELERIKPVFLLAEWKTRDLHARAFDASYAWDWYDTVRRIAQGEAGVSALAGYHYDEENAWPLDAMRMLFVSNHDKNAWEGTQFEAFGAALESAVVLSVASRGIPLIYNGQEAGNPKRLAFFERDPIEWREHPVGDLYRRLFALKSANRALWNGAWGAPMERVPNSAPERVFSFVRTNGEHRVFGVFNLSDSPVTARFAEDRYAGAWRDFASGEERVLEPGLELQLPAWSYRLFTHN
jgi:glycosidase